MVKTVYFDNSSTTLKKPEVVYEAVDYAMRHFANPSRSFYKESLDALRGVLQARIEIAKLVELETILNVAFTSSATESLNLVIKGLISADDHVITTVLEHNSVLRPLYLSGCDLDIVDCDEQGRLMYEQFKSYLKPNTKAIVCTHGSNVLGNVVDVYRIKAVCEKHGCLMILDVSQTLGAIKTSADMADILCFTGHKSLFGPQGTGGIIVSKDIDFEISKTGGAGVDTFNRIQNMVMPDYFEVGTLNSHGLYGLSAGVAFINKLGVEVIQEKDRELLNYFYQAIKDIPGIIIYGDFEQADRLPIIALNLHAYASFELAQMLAEEFHIAVRAQHHCAPLVHERFETELRGMVRFSMSYFNDMDDVDIAVDALIQLASRRGENNERTN